MYWRSLWTLCLSFAVCISQAGADTIDNIVGQISSDQIGAHIGALPGPRDTPASQSAAADYITSQLQSFGYTVTQDPVSQSANLIVHIPGERTPEITFVVGAHFDSDSGSPGADDNAAAVAGILEMARVLAGQHLGASLELVFFAAEEAGLVGSRHYAQGLRNALREISGMLSLEEIAYTCTRPGCQFAFPNIPGCLKIDHPVPNVGTFIAGVGNDASSDLLHSFQTAAARYVPELSVDTAQVAGLGCPADTRRSDHASFWDEDYPALLITDTANFRNPNYHQPTDTLQTLDLTFATRVTQAVLATALRVVGLASDPTPTTTATGVRTPLPTRTPVPPDTNVLLYAGAIIDTGNQRVVGTMPVEGSSLATTPDGQSMYVTHPAYGSPSGHGSVSVVDTATNIAVAAVPIDNPGRVAITPDGRFAYVTNSGNGVADGSIVVIDTASNSIVANVPAQANALGGLAVSPDGQFVYFTDPNRSTVSIIATAANDIVASFAVGESFPAFGLNYPVAVAVTPDGTVAYVTNEEGATVSVIDIESKTVLKNILVHQNPGDLVMTPDGRNAYVDVCCNSHQLDVIDTSLNRVTDTVDLPAPPSSLAITPDGRSVYVDICPHIVIVDTTTNTITNILFVDGCASPITIAAVPNLPPLTPYPTLTPSATAPPMTPSPSATRTASTCAGDCNADGSVTIDEIITMVAIALGGDEVSACGAADANRDGLVTVDEILLAVNDALNGCRPPPTATPTATFGGCSEVCNGRACLDPLLGAFGTCTGADGQGCQCLPFSAGSTPTPASGGPTGVAW